jgi:hypothetical protein
MKLLKAQITVELDLHLADDIDPEWAAKQCVFWKDSWAIDDVPGVSCVSTTSSVASFELIKKQG